MEPGSKLSPLPRTLARRKVCPKHWDQTMSPGQKKNKTKNQSFGGWNWAISQFQFPVPSLPVFLAFLSKTFNIHAWVPFLLGSGYENVWNCLTLISASCSAFWPNFIACFQAKRFVSAQVNPVFLSVPLFRCYAISHRPCVRRSKTDADADVDVHCRLWRWWLGNGRILIIRHVVRTYVLMKPPFNFSANVERLNAVSSYLLTVTCLHTRKSDCPESKVNPWKHGLQFGRGLQLRFLIFSLVQLAAIIQLSCEHLFCPFCFSNAFFLFFIFFSFWIGLWLKKRIEAVVHRLLSC